MLCQADLAAPAFQGTILYGQIGRSDFEYPFDCAISFRIRFFQHNYIIDLGQTPANYVLSRSEGQSDTVCAAQNQRQAVGLKRWIHGITPDYDNVEYQSVQQQSQQQTAENDPACRQFLGTGVFWRCFSPYPHLPRSVGLKKL